ncbi:hypothetical protein CHARACLAT_001102 [Characodon lateralis]|uniref:Uncharacterized protein n=1 Tax=Characodon lateralis TaxID=208331 RepID=A0ABU7DD23_9TELE|nr:hypothetical protein [Characodon lateralis]
MVHLDSISPTSPGIWSKLSRRWELNTSLAKGSAIPSRPSLTAWACQVCPAFSSPSGSNSPPGGDQWTAQPLSSSECPKHAAEGLTKRQQRKYSFIHSRHPHEDHYIETCDVARYGGAGVPPRSQAWGRDSSESAWWLGCSSRDPAGPSPNERREAIPRWAHQLQGEP